MRAMIKTVLAGALIVTLSACSSPQNSERERKEANTPAGKVGQVAYEAAKGSGKVAKAAGKELGKAAHQAHEGWKEAAQKDKEKHQ
jgi:uncharacterized lipoprotein